MTTRNAHPVVERQCSVSRDRQVKSIKSHALLAAGFKRFRTLSGVSQPRSSFDQQPPPFRPALPIAAAHSKQFPVASQPKPLWPASKAMPKTVLPELGDSGPTPTHLSQLRGIHFLSESNPEPDLDTEGSMSTGRPHSIESSNFSAKSAGEGMLSTSHLNNQKHTSSVFWPHERDDSSSLTRITSGSSDDYASSSDLSFQVGQLLEVKPVSETTKLSPRACQAARPPIDLESPYAPHAPTSPLSTVSDRTSNTSSSGPRANAFAIRMGSRNPPAVTKQSSGLTAYPQQHQPVFSNSDVGPSNTQSTLLSISCQNNLSPADPLPSQSLNQQGGSDQCLKPDLRKPHSRHAVSKKPTSKPGGIKEKLGWPVKPKHHHSQNDSTGPWLSDSTDRLPGDLTAPLPGIAFPTSPLEDTEICIQPQQTRSRCESSKSLRENLNHIWSVPIQRLRTSPSLSTLIRNIRPGRTKLTSCSSDASFEARPFSLRTESFCEILDASAIPKHCGQAPRSNN